MSKFNFILVFVLLLYGCEVAAQKETTGKISHTEQQVKPYYQRINDQIDSFTERPLYCIKVKRACVGCDIRVNDFPIIQQFEKRCSGTEMEFPLNPGILSSGIQELTIRIVPPSDQKCIPENAVFEFEINKMPDSWVYDGNREIILPTVKMDAQGLPSWEFKTKFKAEVPFSFVAWKESQDLSKVKNLDKLLDDAYKKIAKIIEDKNIEEFVKIISKTFEYNVMLYERTEGKPNGFQEEPEKLLPMKNCKIALYGNNRLARYEDEEFESCFKFEVFLKNNEKTVYEYPLYFHLPQGASELEVVR
ncbi:hypothetical protein [Prevotella fusca]|jgi:hypothetical protein|uniref:hypothetical protein n=1 Tax=Prevotella fusca TaxID=589436 RepID=UPI003FA031FC